VPGRLPNSTDGQNWQSRGSFGYLKDPRYATLVPTTLFAFNNFFNGKVPMPPSLVMPSVAFTRDYPGAYQQSTQILQMECQDGNQLFGTNNNCATAGSSWKPLTYDGDPAQTGRQKEHTQAAYTSLRFRFDDWRFPVDGNLGVRVVRTRTKANGYTVFKPSYGDKPSPEVPMFGTIDEPLKAEHTYTNVLPSLNLRADLTDTLQARFAFAKAMYRPGFGDLREYIQLKQDVTRNSDGTVKNITYTGTDDGNVNLKPIRANS